MALIDTKEIVNVALGVALGTILGNWLAKSMPAAN